MEIFINYSLGKFRLEKSREGKPEECEFHLRENATFSQRLPFDFEIVLKKMKNKKTDAERWADTLKKVGVDTGAYPELEEFVGAEKELKGGMFR